MMKVAALVLGVAIAFGAGAYAGGTSQDTTEKADAACCCQQMQAGQTGDATPCCKNGECCKDCGDCANGQCKTCKTADCCKGKDCCKDGMCPMKHEAPKAADCCQKH
jgi:hypothetical protein